MKKAIRTPGYDLNERPFMVIWETTRACDLACKHCRAESMPNPHPNALNTDEAKKLLSDVVAFGNPRPIFIFTGGDPFKREDLFELIDYGQSKKMVMALSPSATPLLSYDNLKRAKESGVKAISLSLDGSTPELHDSFRGVNGSYDLTIRGWKYARELGLKLQVNTTVTRYNLYDLPDLFRILHDLGAMTWSVFFLVPVGRGELGDEVSPDDFEAVMHFLYDCSKYISVKTTEGHHYKRVVIERGITDRLGKDPYETYGLSDVYLKLKEGLLRHTQELQIKPRDVTKRLPLHINAGNGFIFISHLGDVYPSGFMPSKAGNVREQSLVEIYRESPLLKTLRNPAMLRGRCGQCEFKMLCGGSRSRAYAVTNDPCAEEPYCTYVPGSFPYKEELGQALSAH